MAEKFHTATTRTTLNTAGLSLSLDHRTWRGTPFVPRCLMHNGHLYLSHPQVQIVPDVDVASWSLNDIGNLRVAALADSGVLCGIEIVISSAETKATETARPLVQSLGCQHVIREMMHENDRSTTGFLPPAEFEATADQFFLNPTLSIRGWETADHAQTRIVTEVAACFALYPNKRILFVGHGAVGTLLFCRLSGNSIDRKYDQRAGGGCFFEFADLESAPETAWQPMETLYRVASN